MSGGPAQGRLGARARGRRGFALLIVLWALVLLALLATHITASGRSEVRIAGNLTNNAAAEAAADGAVYEAVFHLLDTGGHPWEPDGSRHRLKLAGGTVEVAIETEAGKINPNTAQPELLQALLQTVGVDASQSARLAAAIADWREPGDQPRPGGAKQPQYAAAGLDHGPPGEPFESLDELGRVLGMTPAILAAIRPHLSIYQDALPDPRLADPVVRAALQRLGPGSPGAPALPAPPPGVATVSVRAEALMPTGARFIRRAIVKVGATAVNGYTVMTWEQPAEP